MANATSAFVGDRLMNIIGAAAFAGLGLFLIFGSQQFDDAGRSTPVFIGAGLIALSAILVVAQVLAPHLLPPGDPSNGSGRRRLIFVTLLAIWIALLPHLGFLFAGSLMFIIVTLAVPRAERWAPVPLLLHAVCGVLVTLGFWAVLTQLLNVPLPKGTIL